MKIDKKEVSLPDQRLSSNLVMHLSDGHHHTLNATNVLVDNDSIIGLIIKDPLKKQFEKYSITDQYTTKVLFDLLRNGEGYLIVASNKPQPDGREFHWFVKLKKGDEMLFCVPSFPALNDLLLLTEADKIVFDIDFEKFYKEVIK